MTQRTYKLAILALVAGGLLSLFAAPAPPTWESRTGLLLASAVLAAIAFAAWRQALPMGLVLGVGLLLRLFLFPLPPALSDDLWRYLWDGLVQAHGFNPYLFTPNDPQVTSLSPVIRGRLNSGDVFTVYPPISQLTFLLGGFAMRLGGEIAGIYTIKLIAAGAEVVALLLLSRLVSPRALVLYAWNPLVLLEAAGQAHGEALMLPLLVGCLVAMRADRHRLGGALLGGAVMVKLYPLLLIPLLWRRGGWRAIWPALATTMLLALPYAGLEAATNVGESLKLYSGRFEFNAQPYFLLRDLINGLHSSPANVGGPAAGKALQYVLIVGTIFVWLADWRRGWRLDRAFAAILGLYILTATTVHPWYLLGLLALPWTLERPAWHWLAFSLLSLGTYLRYVPNGERAYEIASLLAWLALSLGLVPPMLKAILRHRGRRKAAHVENVADLPAHSLVLDLGCGEGHVGAALAARGHRVVLTDAVDFHEQSLGLPFACYDGRRLPFGDATFDAVVLYFVLHHAADAERVLAEAIRVGQRVIVVESVYRSERGLRVLTFLDTLANRLRGGRLMAMQEEHLHFRRAGEWANLALQLGGKVTLLREHGRPPHRQATLLIQPTA